MAQIFQSCAKDYAGFKNSKKISITWTAADTPLVCDPEHLKEVLDNLLNNAIDAMKESGEIRLTYEILPRKHSALIEVADNGWWHGQRCFTPHLRSILYPKILLQSPGPWTVLLL